MAKVLIIIDDVSTEPINRTLLLDAILAAVSFPSDEPTVRESPAPIEAVTIDQGKFSKARTVIPPKLFKKPPHRKGRP